MPSAPRRKRAPRFVDIAAEALVSESTVNRVLNERGSVSAETRARVLAAARRLGVPRILPETRRNLTRFDVIIAGSGSPYFRRLDLAFQRAMQMLGRQVVMHRTLIAEGPGDERRVAEAILSPRQKRHGLIVAVRDGALVRGALRHVIDGGVPVVTLMSDISDLPRLHYAGIDNYRAGRTIGYLLGRLARRDGRLLLVSNALSYRAHAERMRGVLDVVGAEFPGLRPGAVCECHDQQDLCYAAAVGAIKEGELAAVYNSGAGTPGIMAALRQAGMAGKVVLAGHEISPEHRQYIEQGVMDIVVDQDPDGQVASSIQHLLHACGMQEEAPSREPNDFRLFCRENLGQRPYLPE